MTDADDATAVAAVALLYDKAERVAHLRDALSALGAAVVYESATDAIDRDALEDSRARVVIVNLAGQNEANLDDVYGLLDDARYQVIFNDSDVSSGLSGWDQARWARHLAVKIVGGDIDPPRPADAQAVPVPATRAARAPAAAAAPVAIPVADPADARVLAEASALLAESTPADDVARVAPHAAPAWDLADVGTAFDAGQASSSAATPVEGHDIGEAALAADALAAPGEPALAFDEEDALSISHAPTRDEPGDRLDVDFDDLVEAPRAVPVMDEATHFDLADIEELAATFDAAVPLEEPSDLVPLDFDAESSPAIDDDPEFAHAQTDAPTRVFALADQLTLVPEDDAESTVVPAPSKTESAAPAASDVAVPSGWALEDMLDDVDGLPTAPPAPITGPARFGIEKLSAEEFLSPAADDAGAGVALGEPGGELSFELIPLEEAVAPTQVAAASHESWLVPETSTPAAPKVRRVWVLGASIGGPESVREFLNRFPRSYPALFILAQHLGSEFVDMMTKQLARGTALTIRTPTHGERVGHGEVVVVPATHRLVVDAEGVVVLEKDTMESAYSPSIDRVLQDVADRFGAAAGAIIFSGMSTDAVEGARYLVEKGGRIYAQTPETCVVSSMVDGVIEAGLVGFSGSPAELADKLLAERDG